MRNCIQRGGTVLDKWCVKKNLGGGDCKKNYIKEKTVK